MQPARLFRHRHATAWVLAFALLLAQALGLAHRVAHAPGLPAAAADEHFAGHQAGDAECRLLDQLAHADALVAGAPPALPALPPVAGAGRLPRTTTVAFAAVYLARAPPRA